MLSNQVPGTVAPCPWFVTTHSTPMLCWESPVAGMTIEDTTRSGRNRVVNAAVSEGNSSPQILTAWTCQAYVVPKDKPLANVVIVVSPPWVGVAGFVLVSGHT